MENCDIEHIRAIWNLVLPDKLHHGVELFIRLFDRYPETKAKFPTLRNSCGSPEEMRRSPRLKVHAGRVVIALTSIIEVIDDAELMDENIFFLGDGHNKRRVSIDDFQKFATTFLEYLKDTLLSDVYTPAAADAFSKLMNVFTKRIGEHLVQ